jgi:hypothetical protein
MLTTHRLIATVAAAFVSAAPAIAQQTQTDTAAKTPTTLVATPTVLTNSDSIPKAKQPVKDETKAAPAKATVASRAAATQPKIVIQHLRPVDQRGINVFEAPKMDDTPYEGFALSWGAAFTQQFQGLDHSNTAAPRLVAGVDQNKLVQIGHGFNNAEANLYMNAQLAPGIRVALTSYLSTRHHNEVWIKDGYLLIDQSPIKWEPLENLMQFVTVKAGHFEINYGDSHFRRTDGGNAMFNPFVGNLIMDPFTTEIGGEVYVRLGAAMVMGSVTGGEVRGQVRDPQKRSPSFIGKAGFDRQVMSDLRVRLTGSIYTTKHTINNTLYSGDRAGVVRHDPARPAGQGHGNGHQPIREVPRPRALRPAGEGEGTRGDGNGRSHVESGRRRSSVPLPAGRAGVGGRTLQHRERQVRGDGPEGDGGSDSGERRLVHHPGSDDEGRVREPEVRRLPPERHPERWQVQGLHGRGHRRLLITLA